MMKEFKNELPMWAKGAIGIIIAGGALFIAYKVYSLVKDISDKREEKDVTKEVDKEIVALINKGK